MKRVRRAALLTAVILLAVLTACAGIAPAAKYKVWSSGREAGVKAENVSGTVEDYTLMEGTAETFTVARYFGNNMIVPRDRRIVIWGTAPEDQNGKVVAADFKGLKGSGVIENGEFCFALQGTLPASNEKSCSLVVRGAPGTEKSFDDVLVGDIWIVSGQSNSDLTFYGTVADSTKDILALYGDYLDEATAEDDIRIFQQINWNLMSKTGEEMMVSPQKDVMRSSKWQIAERRRVYGGSGTTSFSMLGYFFAKELYKLNPEVPVGMIMAGCGGASLCLLASPDAVARFPKSLKGNAMILGSVTIPPSGIYNAFMSPVTNVGITGMIFYQGEADSMVTKDYCDAMKITVEDYRQKFGSDLLFLNVQLTSYGYESGGINLDGVWDYVPDMRFAQAAMKIDGCISGYEVIPSYDVGWREGDADGAHPYYKFELGQRGAQMAAALIYGIGDMETAGFPIPSKISYNSKEIVIEYDYAGGGLKTLDGKAPQGFEIKLDGQWQSADVVIEGSTVKIAADNARGVRYASALRYTSTDNANLCSGSGNIAVPFSANFDG